MSRAPPPAPPAPTPLSDAGRRPPPPPAPGAQRASPPPISTGGTLTAPIPPVPSTAAVPPPPPTSSSPPLDNPMSPSAQQRRAPPPPPGTTPLTTAPPIPSKAPSAGSAPPIPSTPPPSHPPAINNHSHTPPIPSTPPSIPTPSIASRVPPTPVPPSPRGSSSTTNNSSTSNPPSAPTTPNAPTRTTGPPPPPSTTASSMPPSIPSTPPTPVTTIVTPPTIAPPIPSGPPSSTPPLVNRPSSTSLMTQASVSRLSTQSSLSTPVKKGSSSVPAHGSPSSPQTNSDLLLSMTSLNDVEVADLFLSSESNYLEGLKIVIDVFLIRLKLHIKLNRPVLSDDEIAKIFLNIENIVDFNQQLYNELQRLRQGGPEGLLDQLGKTMTRYIPFFKLYTDYVKNHRESSQLLTETRKKSDKFDFFIELNEQACKNNIVTLLSSPVARLAQYLIFLGTIYEKMNKIGPCERSSSELATAIRSVQAVTDDIASHLRDEKARKLVVTVQTKYFGNSIDVLSPHRFVVKQSRMKVLQENTFSSGYAWHKCILVLFNDFILYGSVGGKLRAGKVKAVLQLIGLEVEDMSAALNKASYGSVDLSKSFRLKSRTHKPLVFGSSDSSDKDLWMSLIKDQISKIESSSGLQGGSNELQQSLAMNADDFEAIIMKKKPKGGGKPIAPKNIPIMLKPSSSASPLPRTSFNSTTTASTPDAPPMAPSLSSSSSSTKKSPWQKIYDENYQAFYYQNTETGQSVWEKPEDYEENSSASSHRSAPPTPSIPSAPSPPPAPAAPMAPPAPEAPMAPSAPAPPSISDNNDAGSGSSGGSSGVVGATDMFSAIKSMAAGGLKPVGPPVSKPPPTSAGAGPGGVSLHDALKHSLDRYRQFVQDDDDDQDGDDDGDDWDD